MMGVAENALVIAGCFVGFCCLLCKKKKKDEEEYCLVEKSEPGAAAAAAIVTDMRRWKLQSCKQHFMAYVSGNWKGGKKRNVVYCKHRCSLLKDLETSSFHSISHIRVLVVEDTKINRMIARKVLENLNLQCEEAENGKVAVEYFKQGRTFDLVLMDKEMPIMDGLEATRQLRKMGVKTPIIALSATSLESDKDLFFKAGVDDFQTKPISRDKLVQLLARFLAASHEENCQ